MSEASFLVKGAFLEYLFKRSPDGSFTFRGLHNQPRNEKNVLASMFEPGELDEISELIELGDRFGDPILSRSGTGASNFFIDLGKGIGNSVFNGNVVEGVLSQAPLD